MKKITLLLTVFAISTFNIFAQQNNRQKADKYLQEKGEVCFTFVADNEQQFKEISGFLSIGHKHIDRNALEIEAYANEKTFKQFLTYNLPYSVEVSENELQFDPHQAGKSSQALELLNKSSSSFAAWDTTWDAYPTYSEYVAKMNYYAATFPAICSLQSIGTTQNGRELLVLKISDNVATKEAEPEFFYTSSMHGDEIAGYPLMIRLIDYLLNNYGTDTEVTDIVNATEIFINPSANPDGTYGASGSDTIGAPTRANASNQDLNRNYPDNENIGRINGGAGNTSRLHVNSTGGVYENETTAFMNYEASKNFILSANFHGGTELMNYPYDNTYTEHPDHGYYERISVEYATHAQNDSDALGDMTYMTIDEDAATYPSPGVTHGSTWYVVYGGRQDYMNYYRHGNEITVELSDQKYLNASELPNYWEYNKQALLDYMKQVNYGFQGIVSDESGNPVAAKVFISGHDAKNSWVTSSQNLGDYYRLVDGGTYNVTYSAPGYVSQTIPVTVTNNLKTIQNVTLVATTPNPTNTSSFAPTNICDGDTANLTATGTGTLNWYANINDTTPIASGNAYTTPALNANTTYYVEDVIVNPTAGESRVNTGGGFLGGNTRYLEFSATAPVLLKQVTINANQAGEMEVQLLDAAQNIIDTRVILISNPGVQQIDLDFIVPTGTGMRLFAVELSTGLQLYRNNAGTTFPYTNGEISITGSSAVGFYYFFYNWEVENFKSAREAVDVIVTPNPVANFTFDVATDSSGNVTFTNDSNNTSAYTWDFGDSTATSTDENPTHTYTTSGTYNVQLTSNSSFCGNDVIILPVTVSVETLGIDQQSLEGVSIYPNPFNASLSIKLPVAFQNIAIAIYDISGRIIYSEETKNNSETTLNISNLSSLSNGTYLLKLTDLDSKKAIIKKLVK